MVNDKSSFKRLTLCGDIRNSCRQNVAAVEIAPRYRDPVPEARCHIEAAAFANHCTAHMHAPVVTPLNHHTDHISGLKTGYVLLPSAYCGEIRVCPRDTFVRNRARKPSQTG